MIGRLHGILIEKQPPVLMIDIQGIGYEVEATMNTFYKLPEINQTITLYTHFVVREDAQLLYGFADKKERQLFRTLIKVNGIGPKLALSILSSINADEFVQCVQHNDTARLIKLPGVGKKTAERLIIEMRDRLKDWQGASDSAQEPSTANTHFAAQDAISALVTLGYKPQEASRLVSKVDAEKQTSTEAIIREALKEVA